jgi:hypothetical protein
MNLLETGMARIRNARFAFHKAKSTILWFALGFCLIQLIVDFVVDRYWPRIHSSYLAAMEDRIGNLRRAPTVVVFGSSRLQMAVYEKEFQARLQATTGDPRIEAFNACIPAQDFCTAEYVFDEMVKKNRAPSLLVLEITPEMVAQRNRWLGAHVLPSLKNCRFTTYLGDILRSENVARLVRERATPVYRYRQEIQHELGLNSYTGQQSEGPNTIPAPLVAGPSSAGGNQAVFAASPSPAQTFAPESLSDKAMSKEALERTMLGLPRFELWLKDYKVGGTASLALERILFRCEQLGITAILVCPPVSSYHRKVYTPSIDAAFLAYVHTLEATKRCYFHDCRASLPDNLFYDHHHVEWQGTMEFSRILAEEVVGSAWTTSGGTP